MVEITMGQIRGTVAFLEPDFLSFCIGHGVLLSSDRESIAIQLFAASFLRKQLWTKSNI
jgi:hypothetical protein